jgi:hypothetical protein
VTTRTRPYLIRDRDGDVLAVVRHCSGPAHAIRAYYQRLGLTAHVASADDAIAAVASGIAPFSADDPTADAAPGQDAKIAAIAADVRSLDLHAPSPLLVPRDSEGTPIPPPGEDPYLLPAHDDARTVREPTQAELEASDFAHDAALAAKEQP